MLKMLIFYEKMKKYDIMLMNIENRNKGEALWNPLIF